MTGSAANERSTVRRMSLKVTQALWLLIAGFALVVALTNMDDHHGEAAMLMVMLVLAFPLSLPVTGVLAGIAWMLDRHGVAIPNTVGVTLIDWILLVAAGWLQWFWLVPRLLAHWRSRRQVVSVVMRED